MLEGSDAASRHGQSSLSAGAFPAYVLRRAGILDPLNESLTRHHE
jgi:hypothetical protein